MALMALGPVVFDLVTNVDKTKMDKEAVFARHDVVGAAPIFEAMGEGETGRTLTGTVHPNALGTNGSLAALEAAMTQQIPLPLMLGSYRPLGWYVITDFTRDEDYLDAGGMGEEIQFTVELQKVDSIGSFNPASILNLFASALR